MLAAGKSTQVAREDKQNEATTKVGQRYFFAIDGRE